MLMRFLYMNSFMEIIAVHVLPKDERCAEIDQSCNWKAPTILVMASSTTSQTDGDKGDSCAADPSSFDKVEESVGKMNLSNLLFGSPIYQPNDILERLALPPPKDLESLIFDAGADAAKVSARRTLRQGRWIRVTNSSALQSSTGLPLNLESLTFDQSLKLSVRKTKLLLVKKFYSLLKHAQLLRFLQAKQLEVSDEVPLIECNTWISSVFSYIG